jgi:hypothetical protein
MTVQDMRIRNFIFSLLLFSSFSHVRAEKTQYPVSDIPDSLLVNAKAVIRESILEFELRGLNQCIKHEKKAITILDRSGEKLAYGFFPYDKESQIYTISAKLYTKDGTLFKTYWLKDFKDHSMDSYGTLYSDSRYLYLSGAATTFPYTIEYNVTYNYTYSYNFPFWLPQDDYDLSLQHAMLKVIVPNDFELLFRENKMPATVQAQNTGNKKEFIWELNNLKAIETEPFTPERHQQLPNVELNPSVFKFDRYQGSMTSWKEFGRFFQDLNKGRNDISDAMRDEIGNLVSGIENQREKVKVLYKYMQNRTRYVGIQVGIGGFQPFPASTVEKYGYGDCKALVNFMQAILEAAGIESFYSLIDAGKARYFLDTTFVTDHFNHVILNVPLNDEEMWLECTSQIMPFGFLGDFTDDRFALVITDKGGILKRTPRYGLDKSIVNGKAWVMIDENGNAQASTSTGYSGLGYDNIIGVLHMSPEKQEDYLYDKKIDISDFKIKAFEYRDTPDQFPYAIEKLELELFNYASVSGSRMFIGMNLMNKFDYIPPRDNDRKTPIALNPDMVENDTVIFTLPQGYSVEHCPEREMIESEFGKYTCMIEVRDSNVVFTRHYELYGNSYPKEKYDEYVKFCRAVTRADKQKLILVKN